MCACKPGSTCSYHLYRNWPQARKDEWNARRRSAYQGRKGGAGSFGAATGGGNDSTGSGILAGMGEPGVVPTSGLTDAPAIVGLGSLMAGGSADSNGGPRVVDGSTVPVPGSGSSLMDLMSGKAVAPLVGGTHVEGWSDPLDSIHEDSVRAAKESEYARGLGLYAGATEDERAAVRLFKSSEYGVVNSGAGYQAEKARLKDLIQRAEATNGARDLYRGEAPGAGVTGEQLSARFQVGASVSWGDRFASASSDPSIGVAFANGGPGEGILLQFKNTRRGGSLASDDDSHGREAESLISGESRFRVVSKSRELIGGVERLVVVLEDEVTQ